MTLFDLSGRVAIVTGGNGGIGLGMAHGLAAAGARIVVAARDRDKAEKAIAKLGQESCFIPFDAANESSCRGVVGPPRASFGAHPGRALGQSRRPRRSGGIPRLRRLGFSSPGRPSPSMAASHPPADQGLSRDRIKSIDQAA
ncbi:MAG: SDR family NAD(P)-dependent oxidoreductase [Stellaceae bacterium]